MFDPHLRGAPPDVGCVPSLLQVAGDFLIGGQALILHKLQNRRTLRLQGFKRRKEFAEYFMHNLLIHGSSPRRGWMPKAHSRAGNNSFNVPSLWGLEWP